MPSTTSARSGKQFSKMVLYGFSTLALYFTLYLFEDDILDFTSRGVWYFILPVLTAFLFSFAHGNFTALFWDILGVKAKK
jgi:hypothetical protein